MLLVASGKRRRDDHIGFLRCIINEAHSGSALRGVSSYYYSDKHLSSYINRLSEYSDIRIIGELNYIRELLITSLRQSLEPPINS